MPEANIVWLSTNGFDTGTCTRSAPCSNLVYGITQSSAERPHIVFEQPAVDAEIKLTITPGSTTAPKLYLHGNGSSFADGGFSGIMLDIRLPMLVRDVTFFSTTASMVPIDAEAATELDHVTLLSTKHLAIDAAVNATDLKIVGVRDAPAAIVVKPGVDFSLERGVISLVGTAISAGSGSHVHIENLLAHDITGRALELSLAAGELNYSTITGGTTATSAPSALNCSATMHVTGSIIWAPVCVNGMTPCDAVPSGCTYVSSIVSNAMPPSGTTNSNPMFVDEQIGNYHIQPTSPARDAVSTGPATDFEGDARPGGSAFDIGADEIP